MVRNYFTVVVDGDSLFAVDGTNRRFPIPEGLEKSFEKVPAKAAYITVDKNTKEEKLHIVRAPFLHMHSDASLLDGANKVEVLAERVDDVCAITDHGSMSATFRFYKAMKEAGKTPIIGYEAYAETLGGKKESCHMVLLVKNDTGYRNLCQIVTKAESNFYRKPHVSYAMLEEHHEGLICLSACLGGEIPSLINEGKLDEAGEVIENLIEIFGDDFYLELQRHNLPEEPYVNKKLIEFGQKYKVKLVATTDSHYPDKDDAYAHEILLAVGTHSTLADEKRYKFSGEGYHIYTADEFEDLWSDVSQVWVGLYDVIKKIDFDFETGKVFMPEFEVPNGFTQETYFEKLVRDGYAEKFPVFESDADRIEHEERLEYEIRTILSMGFPGYFLIVSDFISYARSIGGFVGPGRGSAVGSLVAFCLGITSLDPIPYGLLFERFLNPERISMPDIDIDFDVEVRPKVIEYVRRKYGEECVSRIITFGTLAPRAVVRDVGRVMVTDQSVVAQFAKTIPAEPKMTLKKAAANPQFQDMLSKNPELLGVVEVASRLEGLSRHKSQHACGVVIANKPISSYVPEVLLKDPHTNEKTRTASYTMGELEELGLLKMDFLGLRNMSVIRDVAAMCPQIPADGSVSLTDPYVYKMIGTGETAGIFQIESAGMQNLMKQMFSDVSAKIAAKEAKYGCSGYGDEVEGNNKELFLSEMTKFGAELFERLVAAIALYRPGPMDYIPDYIEGMNNPSEIHYDCPQLEPILAKTYGVIVYQEQVQQIVRELAGYSLGRGDLIRRAMGKKKQSIMDAEKNIFLYGNADTYEQKGEAYVPGCLANGISESAALTIWGKMETFAAYAFNKSHAAGYAVISITTAWMKKYTPVEFMIATLNSFVTKADQVQYYLAEARNMGIKILGPSVNNSEVLFTKEDDGIRVGLMSLRNLGKMADEVISARTRKWTDIEEFLNDMLNVVDKRVFESLALSGAFDEFGYPRKVLFEKGKDVAELLQKIRQYSYPELPQIPEIDEIFLELNKIDFSGTEEFPRQEFYNLEYKYCGMYVTGHPLDGMSDFFKKKDVVSVREILPIEDEDGEVGPSAYAGKTINVVGIARTIKPKITKNGSLMYFVDIEDATGTLGLAAFPKVVDGLKENGVNIEAFEGQPVLVNGLITSDAWGTKMNIKDISLIDENLVSERSHIKIDTPDNSTILDLEKAVSLLQEGNTEIRAYRRVCGEWKYRPMGKFKVSFGDFLTLRDSFRLA